MEIQKTTSPQSSSNMNMEFIVTNLLEKTHEIASANTNRGFSTSNAKQMQSDIATDVVQQTMECANSLKEVCAG